MFFTNKQELINKIATLEIKEADLTRSKNTYKERNSGLEKEFIILKKTVDDITSERNKLKKMVREQTEADLLINALKGLGIIQAPKAYDSFAEQNRLLDAQRQVGAMRSGYQSGLGLSGVLGSGF